MPIEIGQVVRSLAGHDAGGFFVVVSTGDGWVELADGRRRKLEAPKRKSQKHIRKTNTVLEPSGADTNRKLREALRAFRPEGGKAVV